MRRLVVQRLWLLFLNDSSSTLDIPPQVDFRAFVDTLVHDQRPGDGTESLATTREQQLAHSSIVPGRQTGEPPSQSMSRQQIQDKYSDRYVTPSMAMEGGGGPRVEGSEEAGRPLGGVRRGNGTGLGGGADAAGMSPYASSSFEVMSDTQGSAFFTPGGSISTLPVQAESSLGFSAAPSPVKSAGSPSVEISPSPSPAPSTGGRAGRVR